MPPVIEYNGHNGEPIENHHHSLNDIIAGPYDPPFPQNGIANAPHMSKFATSASTWRICLKSDVACCQITLDPVSDYGHTNVSSQK